jgi:hypothetical protein
MMMKNIEEEEHVYTKEVLAYRIIVVGLISGKLVRQQQQPKFQDEYSDYIPTAQQKRIYSLKIDTSIN